MLFKTSLLYYTIFVFNFFVYFLFEKLYKYFITIKKFTINNHYSIIPLLFFFLYNFSIILFLFLIPIYVCYFFEKNSINKILIVLISYWVLLFTENKEIFYNILTYIYLLELISFTIYIYIYILVVNIINKFINKYYLILFFFFLSNFVFSLIFILILVSYIAIYGSFIIKFLNYFYNNIFIIDILVIITLIKFGANLLFLYKIDLYKNFNFSNIISFSILSMWVYILLIKFMYIFLFFNNFLVYYKLLIFLSNFVIFFFLKKINQISFYFNISTLLSVSLLTLLINNLFFIFLSFFYLFKFFLSFNLNTTILIINFVHRIKT